jgi:branched-chain amino acid transport system permease protein
LIIAAVVVSQMVNGAINLQALNTGMATALIMLALVVLSGYGGQIVLCIMSLAGIGAVIFLHLAHGGSPLALIPCAVVCGAVGALVALPALRLQGLYLALSTLAFAVLADDLFFGNSHVFGGSGSSSNVHRISIPGFAIKNNHENLIFLAAVFGIFGIAVLAIRRGQFGRTLAAMRDSDAACATLGLDLTVTKVAVFALAAAMAGVAGALYGGTQAIVGSTDFYYVQSLVLFLMVYTAGIDTVTGALVGGLLLGAAFPIITPHIPAKLQQLSYLAPGLGAITVAQYGNMMTQISTSLERMRHRRSRPAAAAIPEGGGVVASVG